MSTAMRKELEKAKKVLHPNSRKSIAIMKKTHKISNRQKAKTAGMIKQNLVGEKMLWIKEHMSPDVSPYTPELTAELLERYIARNDEELEQISIKRSIGNKRKMQHASREDVLRMTKERDKEDYETCGIEIPDILTPVQCEMLRNWSGELRLLTNFKFRRFGKKHLKEILEKKTRSKNRVNKVSESSTNAEDPNVEDKDKQSVDNTEIVSETEKTMEIE